MRINVGFIKDVCEGYYMEARDRARRHSFDTCEIRDGFMHYNAGRDNAIT